VTQITEALQLHYPEMNDAEAETAHDYGVGGKYRCPMLRRFRDYPHRCRAGSGSGVMIAMALACEPQLLIADEHPHTALDVTECRRDSAADA